MEQKEIINRIKEILIKQDLSSELELFRIRFECDKLKISLENELKEIEEQKANELQRKVLALDNYINILKIKFPEYTYVNYAKEPNKFKIASPDADRDFSIGVYNVKSDWPFNVIRDEIDSELETINCKIPNVYTFGGDCK